MFITSASSGFGKVTALACGRDGMKIVLASRRVAEGEAVAREIRAGGGEALGPEALGAGHVG